MIVYASRTGNVRHIVKKLQVPCKEITHDIIIDTPYFLFTYTDGLGAIPLKVLEFLKKHHKYCRGVIASGNINFGHQNFCGAADKISMMYGVPIIDKVDLRGDRRNYEKILNNYNTLIKGEGIEKVCQVEQ